MPNKSTRFAGPFLVSICSLALIVPTAAVAQRADNPAAKSGLATADSAQKLSPQRFKDKHKKKKDGRGKDGPRDKGPKDGNDDDHPTSP